MSEDRSKLTHFYYEFDYVRMPFIRCKQVPCTKEEAISRANNLRVLINKFRPLKLEV